MLSGSADLEVEGVQRGFNVFTSERESRIASVIVAQTKSLLERARSPSIALQLITVPILHGSVLAIQTLRCREKGREFSKAEFDRAFTAYKNVKGDLAERVIRFLQVRQTASRGAGEGVGPRAQLN